MTKLTSKHNLPVWCYACGAKATYSQEGLSFFCDECGHEYELPKRKKGEGNGHNFKRASRERNN